MCTTCSVQLGVLGISSGDALKKIFIQSEGQCFGPCSVEEARSLLLGGWISLTCPGQYEGETDWRPLSSFPELTAEGSSPEAVPLLAPQAPETARPKGPSSQRSRWIGAGILVVFMTIGAATLWRWWPGKKAATPASAWQIANALRSTRGAPTNEALIRSSPRTQPSTNSDAIVANRASREVAPQIPWRTGTGPRASNAPAANTGSEPHPVLAVGDPANAPFIQYDRLVIDAVRQRWLALLAPKDDVRGPRGRVTIEFRQDYLGQIPEVRVTQTEVGDAWASLCQRAILEAGPFPPWPKELRRTVSPESRLASLDLHGNHLTNKCGVVD